MIPGGLVLLLPQRRLPVEGIVPGGTLLKMNILATLTENQMCVLVFAGSIFVMFACAWLLPFNDNWPDGKA